MDFPKKQQQSLIPRYLLQYLQDLQISHNDPTAPWGGGGGGGSYTAGDGIDITNDVISIDDTVALKTDLLDYVTTSELTTELSNYVTSTDLATELLDYAELSDLATVATTGSYNDLLNKPTIPTDTSDLTNGAGYITSSALSGYATQSWVLNQGYIKTGTTQTISGDKTFSGSTVFTGATSYQGPYYNVYLYRQGSAGVEFVDASNDSYYSVIYPGFIDLNGNSGRTTFDGNILESQTEYKIRLKRGRDTIGEYTFKNKTGDVAVTSEIPDAVSGTNDGTNWTSLTIGNTTYNIPSGGGSSYSAGTGIDITNNTIAIDSTVVALKSDIPNAVSGTYSGSNWTSITIGNTTKNIPSGGSAPTNMVTTDTDQNITAVKTFIGSKMIALKEAADGNFLGFTAYNTAGNEFGNLQCGTRSVKLYTGSTAYSQNKKLVTLGNYSNNNTLQKDCYVGFRVKDLSNQQRNFVLPKSSFSTYYNVGSADTYYVPMGVTNGTTTCLASDTGIIDISSLISGGGGGTTVSGTNDGTNWTSITIGSDTYGIPSGGGGGGSSLAPQIYNFTAADWSGLTTSNSYIISTAMTREGLDLSTLTPGQTVKIDCIFVRPSNGTSYIHQFTLVIPDGDMATESTDTFQIPGTNQTNTQIEAWMQISNNRIGLYWSNTSQRRFISKVKVYPANA